MKVEATIIDAEAARAELRIAPAWWDRLLFGARTIERRARRDDGAVTWRWADTGRRITQPAIRAALSAAHRRAATHLVERLVARLYAT